ncbi:hypothetical protein [Leeuwenhoekiella parthenopeia]|uniref:Lipoprotein n=1 Tax=Leeuwenhoekiella parthenopeia TaxID=2890320 RepID=A0ABS8GPP2_9FLAO|nr:hypothetical protein [Leeuwenhoekiella parthenopeia]MCC4211252.1 hypothetical protein [Leeuwenhoekiella parthenopeia]
MDYFKSITLVFCLLVLYSCDKDDTALYSKETSDDSLVSNLILTPQSPNQLINNYTGNANFDSNTGILTFTSSGKINFPNRSQGQETRWFVPPSVSKIIIKKQTRVEGQFDVATGTNVIIQGENKFSSKVFGTNLQAYSGTGGLIPVSAGEFSAFLSSGNGTNLIIDNLTSINPKGWHSRANYATGARLTLKNSRFIDDRGGFGNHSDGVHNADLVENCYFETGDDIICDYSDAPTIVRNCEINLVQNAMPIQYGYNGPTSGNNTLTIENLLITGDVGRNGASLIQCLNRNNNSQTATKTINIDGLYFRPSNNNSKGFIVNCDDNITLQGTWKNVNINVADYFNSSLDSKSGQAISFISICNTTNKYKNYNCGNPPMP